MSEVKERWTVTDTSFNDCYGQTSTSAEVFEGVRPL